MELMHDTSVNIVCTILMEITKLQHIFKIENQIETKSIYNNLIEIFEQIQGSSKI